VTENAAHSPQQAAFLEEDTMRAITIEHGGAVPALRSDLPSPTPPAGEVLVRVRASSVNPVDGAIAAGMLEGMVEHAYPITLGRDFAGTVEAVGDGVISVAAGDEVLGVVPAMSPAVHAGSWAELISVAETDLVERPGVVDLAVAGAAGLAGVTAATAVDAIAPQAGESVLVVGATGGVGTVAVQLLRAAGATVVAPALPEDETYLRDLGVTEVVPRDGDVVAALRDRYPDGVDALIDLVSYVPGVYDDALKPGARVASTLNAAGEGPGHTNVSAAPGPDPLGRLAGLLADRGLELPITATYELHDAPTGLADLGAKHTRGKLAVRVT
jgi:NADPH:quinone reductase-like Zn-dependent oxidoreductase